MLNLFFNNWINGGANRSKTRIRVEKRGSVDLGGDPRVRKQTPSERRAIHPKTTLSIFEPWLVIIVLDKDEHVTYWVPATHWNHV